MVQHERRSGRAKIGALAALVAVAAACSSADSVREGAQAVPVALATDGGLSVTVDDVVTADAASARVGAATVLTSPTTLDARVTVPDSALQGDVSGDDITATVLSFDSEVDGAGGITFDLGPDGAQFDEPVLLEWEGPWAPMAVYSLAAYHGDGTPIEESGRTDANSIAALRVEPTSSTTARYTLPVDHFSTWAVNMEVVSGGDTFRALVEGNADRVLAAIGTDVTTVLRMTSYSSRPLTDVRNCSAATVTRSVGPVTASFPLSTPWCRDSATNGYYVNTFPLTITCTEAGDASVDVAVHSLMTISASGRTRPPLDAGTKMGLATAMLRYSTQLRDGDGGTSTAFEDESSHGALIRVQTTVDVTCEEAETTTTTSTTTTTTVAEGGAASTIATSTTVPGAPNGSAPGITVPASPTTPSAPAPATTTTVVPPTTLRPTVPTTPTITAPASTTPATTAPATTAPATVPPTTPSTAPWGPLGLWVYNEFEICDHNGTGGCGYYYGYSHGEYILGPLGGPGVNYFALS